MLQSRFGLYPGLKIKKLECVGQVQKRVGSRLRALKKKVKNLDGRGKLTKKSIDRLQNYYGIAVRANSYNLAQMKKTYPWYTISCRIFRKQQLSYSLSNRGKQLVSLSK